MHPPCPHGTHNPIVFGLLQLCAVTILASLLLTLYGLLRSEPAAQDAARNEPASGGSGSMSI